MKPFRFFFALSLGIVLFLFFARFIIVAFVIAALLSGVYFIARKIKGWFDDHDWMEEDHFPPRRFQKEPVWKDDLLVDYPSQQSDYIENYRKIKVQ